MSLSSHGADTAREPDAAGRTQRGGVRLAWRSYGTGDTTVLLMPTWQIVDSRFWKAQVGHLARHFRVVTYDGRGSGDSDRPVGPHHYANRECAEDALAVLDATDTERAVVVALSAGTTWTMVLAADHPDRVQGIVAISPAVNFADGAAHGRDAFDERLAEHRDWDRYNRHYWTSGGFPDFTRFFFAEMFSEPHSTKQQEDTVRWASAIDPSVLVDASVGRMGLDGVHNEPMEQVCARVRCPVLVIQGTEDRIRPAQGAERLAELTGGRRVLIEGGGHGLFSRDPVQVNRILTGFVDGISAPRPSGRSSTWTHAASRPRRVLYLSSPIGLGHAARDLAVVRKLRETRPDIQVDWLAQHPVTAVLERAGERVHPASRWLAGESGHFEREAGEHDLHAFQALRRMDAILVHNFMVFAEVVEQEHYDLVVGDEAWDVDYFLHENPELKRFAFVWMTDFVGYLPMPEGGTAEAALTADYNAEMIEQRARFARVRDLSLFVGSAEDVVPASFGPGLPRIRDWMAENFAYTGYVTGFDPAALPDRAGLRRSLGMPEDRRVCVVTVGGTGVGRPLLERVLDAVPIARRQEPDLHFLVVSGPRIDPASLPRRRATSVRGYLPRLYRYLAASDVAVVQGGLTTCMELAATQRPFVYVPLRHHFEQAFHVRHRLERYRAGRALPYEQAVDPDQLAEALLRELRRPLDYRPVETDGAARAAAMLDELL